MDFSIAWNALFVPSMHIGGVVLRGTLVYLFLFFLLRILRREAGHIGISDVVVVVLIADAAQNAMASEYRSLSEGAILVGTIAFWHYFLDWLAFKVPAVRRRLRPAPMMLSRTGVCRGGIWNMKRSRRRSWSASCARRASAVWTKSRLPGVEWPYQRDPKGSA